MEKEMATTYKEYKNGVKQVAGFGKGGCYQGLDYLYSLLDIDRYYSEELEDSIVFIESYINSVETQLKKQKEIIDKMKTTIKNDMDGFTTINEHGESQEILDLLEIYLEILEDKEV